MNRVSQSGKAGLRSAACVTFSAFALLLVGGCGDRSETAVAESARPPEVQYGSKITFGKGGNSEPHKKNGWSPTEEKFTWTEGSSARLEIPVPASNEPVTLKMRIAALIKPPELPFQPVEVSINDQKIADWQVAETSEFAARVPPELTKQSGVLKIEIKTPKATSPKTLGISADPRVLGACVLELQLAKE
ncbi:MAG TPA: hypothetical protein VEX43_17125 [Chthoniobacterales bacterium]|nr:hypothetical protein [Chthoniobacterales bacterium]